MTSRRSFIRKIIYLVAIAVLLMPLFWLSQPATSAVKGSPGSPGGKLAHLRDDYHLSPARLGQVDPTSVTIKLATLGLRGVAANILWQKATDFKMKKDWTNLGATLNQITKVQPNFVNVWSNQAWNLSYNVSVEFDDYRQRYRWVIKGIDFLKEGIRYNERQPRLLWDMGWFISQKIGKADESKQYRKLFKEDDDFHGARPLALRDNWLVGKEWFDRAVEMVDTGASMLSKSPLIYRSSGPMCQMSYAEYLEKDGTFGEVAKGAWAGAARQWQHYGSEEIPTSFKDEKTQEPIVIRLGEEEMHEQAAKKRAAQLEAFQPGLRQKIVSEKRAALTAAQRAALDTPAAKRTGKQFELAEQAEQSIQVTHNEVARRIKGPKHDEAMKLAKEAADHEQIATYIRRYREIVNFVYWRLRADLEQTEEMLTARSLTHQGDRAYAEGDLMAARTDYRQGLERWRKVLDKAPALIPDQTAGEELMDVIKRYRRILGQLDEPFPDPFILQDVIDAHAEKQAGPAPKRAKEPAKKGQK
jgi:hypothetical protein